MTLKARKEKEGKIKRGIEKGIITLKLQLAPKTEKRLRVYIKKQFDITLEEKLQDVLIEWIGKAISNNREIEKVESKS